MTEKNSSFRPTKGSNNSKPLLQLLTTGTLVIIGQEVFRFALPLALHEATGSSSTVFLSVGVSYLPNLLFALVIGVLVDQFNRKSWTMSVLLGNALSFAALALVLSSGASKVVLFALVFSIGFLNYCFAISRTAVVKDMLESEQILTFNSRIQVVDSVASIGAPVLAGFLVVLSAPSSAFLVIAAIYLMAFFSSLAYPDMPVFSSSKERKFVQSIKEGAVVLYHNKPLWRMTWIVAFVNVPMGIQDALLVLYLKEEVGLSAQAIGVVFSGGAVGAIAGGTLSSRLRHIGLGRVWLTVIFSLSFVFTGYLLSNSPVWLAFINFVFNALGVIFIIYIWTYRQESTDSAHIGRVAGLTGSVFKLLLPVVLIGLAALQGSINYTLLFLFGGGILFLSGLVAMVLGIQMVR